MSIFSPQTQFPHTHKIKSKGQKGGERRNWEGEGDRKYSTAGNNAVFATQQQEKWVKKIQSAMMTSFSRHLLQTSAVQCISVGQVEIQIHFHCFPAIPGNAWIFGSGLDLPLKTERKNKCLDCDSIALLPYNNIENIPVSIY